MSAAALLERNPSPTDDEIDAAMAGIFAVAVPMYALSRRLKRLVVQ